MVVLDNFCAWHKITFHYEITHCLCISFLTNISPRKKAFVERVWNQVGKVAFESCFSTMWLWESYCSASLFSLTLGLMIFFLTFFFLKNGNYIFKTLFYMLEVFIRCFSDYSYYIKLLNEVVIVLFQSGAVFFTFFRLWILVIRVWWTLWT